MRRIEPDRARAAMVASYQAVTVTRDTLDGVLGQAIPAGWDDVSYVLKATGRAELTDSDRASLGALATRFPLLG
jgi:hypothetical protein